ncbi:MAG: NAD-dependent epimerase/dehydratase [Rhizobium sp.]|nr:NAD-dependent epimerase/dehydratase [Rhizobium sp.]
MKMMILGAGFSGKAIARTCAPDFQTIYGTTRSEAKFAALETGGIIPLAFDGSGISPELKAALASVTHLVQSISPEANGDVFLKLVPRLKDLMPVLGWIGYLSTIGVYGDRKGAWIDEDSPPAPLSNRSRERVLAENQWLETGARENIPVAVLRLAGIYGPGRNPFLNLANGTARRIVKKDQVFNRIRVEDIGRATAFLIDRNIGGIYNVTDHSPSPTQDTVEYAARLMGVSVPPDILFETAELSPMQRSFYGENKRVSNARLRGLGFEFLYPEYRNSFDEMWAKGIWKG